MYNIPKGKYRHYKGGEYQVIGTGRHTETQEPLVVYKALYDSSEFGPNAIWIRPLSMFVESVQYQGRTIPRFTKLD